MQDLTFGGYKIIASKNNDNINYKNSSSMKIAVLIHLYYKDTIHEYFKYIQNIPSFCTKIFTYSDEGALNIIKSELESNNCSENCVFIKKENRGRDISALLVAARTELLKYDLICFAHDKGAHNKLFAADTKKWINELWTNTLDSEDYIRNIIDNYENDPKLGVLFPPYPFGEVINHGATSGWGKDFENTVILAKRIGLKVLISKNMEPCSVGTMFWARTDALRPLLEYPWQYTDFDEEPLAYDGTISHAVERIIRFTSLSQEYKEYLCISDSYVCKYLSLMHVIARNEYSILEEKLELNSRDISFYNEWTDNVDDISSRYKKIYLYGAGHYGSQCIKYLRLQKTIPKGIIVTENKSGKDDFYGVPIIELNKFNLPGDACIIITAERSTAEKIYINIKQELGSNVLDRVFYYQTEDEDGQLTEGI